MLNSIICGATLYALVLISVAIILPHTDLLRPEPHVGYRRCG